MHKVGQNAYAYINGNGMGALAPGRSPDLKVPQFVEILTVCYDS